MITDKDRIAWIENKLSILGGSLISDDNGHFAISCDGFQEVLAGKQTIATTFILLQEEWKDSAREAIDYAMEQCE